MKINELVEKAHKNAVEKGFWEHHQAVSEDIEMFENTDFENLAKQDYTNSISTMLMLIVSELSEALEALRKNNKDNFREELADVAIRLGDLCGGLDIDLEKEIIVKMNKNAKRPYKHGKEF